MNKRIAFLTSILIFLLSLVVLSQNGVLAAEISDIEISGLSEPVVGIKQRSLAKAPDDANYTVMFEEWWKEVGGILETDEKFEKGVKYSYAIYIKAKDNFTFADNATATIDGKTLILDRTYGDSIVFTLDYGIAKEIPLVSNIEITDVTMPVAGQKPSYTGKVPKDANYNINDEFWYDKTGREVTEKFEEGKSYTYYCIISTINNFIFGDDVTAIVNNNNMEYESSEGNLLVFSYEYKIRKSENLNSNDNDELTDKKEDNKVTDKKEDNKVTDKKDEINEENKITDKKDDTPKTGNSQQGNIAQVIYATIIALSIAFVIKRFRKNK